MFGWLLFYAKSMKNENMLNICYIYILCDFVQMVVNFCVDFRTLFLQYVRLS